MANCDTCGKQTEKTWMSPRGVMECWECVDDKYPDTQEVKDLKQQVMSWRGKFGKAEEMRMKFAKENEALKHQLQLATDQLELSAKCDRCHLCQYGAEMTLVLMREVEDGK